MRSSQLDKYLKDMSNILSTNMITSNHYFIDTTVSFGNTYFYRIQAVSPIGKKSDWIARGCKLTNEEFEKFQNEILSQDEKANLLTTYKAATYKSNHIDPLSSKPVLITPIFTP